MKSSSSSNDPYADLKQQEVDLLSLDTMTPSFLRHMTTPVASPNRKRRVRSITTSEEELGLPVGKWFFSSHLLSSLVRLRNDILPNNFELKFGIAALTSVLMFHATINHLSQEHMEENPNWVWLYCCVYCVWMSFLLPEALKLVNINAIVIRSFDFICRLLCVDLAVSCYLYFKGDPKLRELQQMSDKHLFTLSGTSSCHHCTSLPNILKERCKSSKDQRCLHKSESAEQQVVTRQDEDEREEHGRKVTDSIAEEREDGVEKKESEDLNLDESTAAGSNTIWCPFDTLP